MAMAGVEQGSNLEREIIKHLDFMAALGRMPQREMRYIVFRSYGFSQQEIADSWGVNRRTIVRLAKHSPSVFIGCLNPEWASL